MAKVICKNCGGDVFKPRYFDAEANPIRGMECQNCHAVRLVKTRKAPKRDARKAQTSATIKWLLECSAP